MKAYLLSIALLCSLMGCTSAKKAQPLPASRGEAPPFIFMQGEFNNPGTYAWTNGMTLKDGIDTASGSTDSAPRRFRLQHWDGSVERFRLGAGRTLTNNPALRSGDSVFSPRVPF
jgi:protein involved in polysaccharide export with SLBB domain